MTLHTFRVQVYRSSADVYGIPRIKGLDKSSLNPFESFLGYASLLPWIPGSLWNRLTGTAGIAKKMETTTSLEIIQGLP